MAYKKKRSGGRNKTITTFLCIDFKHCTCKCILFYSNISSLEGDAKVMRRIFVMVFIIANFYSIKLFDSAQHHSNFQIISQQ